jgi:hypothetical protein
MVSFKARFEENIPRVSSFSALHMMAFSAGGARAARQLWAAFWQ